MAPTPQETAHAAQPAPAHDGERVVISGMSGLFPQSHHVKDLADILYNKENAIKQTTRWNSNHPEVVQYSGNVPDLNLFDAQFFKVHYLLGNSMDSMARKILEQAYQAIYDAGVSPEHLNGKKVGVYIGSCFSETEKFCFYVSSKKTGFGIAGCSKTMFANRISYWLNSKGPSMGLDGACSSSIAALEQAYQDIYRGECEAAIVGGTNLSLLPQSSVHYGRIITLCTDGKTKSFDQNADGVAKTEAINVLFLQKAKNAKRIYAEVLYVKTEFSGVLEVETGLKYGFYRDPLKIAEFMKQFYKEAKVPPQAVEYVEAFGSADPEADKAELEALEEVFCKDRNDPLLVGSVMSNIGYSEAASGISAITKVLLGYHTGKLAANLHCESPRKDVAALREGHMRIVTEHQQFARSYTAVNGLSYTGVNSHVLLHGDYRPKDPHRYKSNIPRLVTISARQDTSVQKILDDLKSRPIDPEEIALFHNIHSTNIAGHLGRGYIILDTNADQETVSLAETVNYFDDAKPPLWFVYSGMGSQWAGMGATLMRIPVFAAAIERCQKVLEPKGVDIVHIITDPDKDIFKNILNSFVGIAAVQIGLTDILTSLGIVPDMIIGHSVGELGCAYADGCLTAEEMILSAYSRGLVSVETSLICGSMAAVGIGYQQISKLVPSDIEVACHNGPNSSTISGPADKMHEFVEQLTAQGIFAKEVPCSNIAYHSSYIAKAGPGLLEYLSKVIKNPKPRSERWISTSVPQDKWGEPAAKMSSAQYHTNNLLNPVLFEEASRLIPPNAVLVEIAPHGLLQAILKRSLPETCRHVPLTRRGHTDNAFFVLDAVGKLYMEGYNPKVEALYPKVQFPVSTGTPMLSHLVEWAHNERWTLPLYISANRMTAASCIFAISIHEAEYQYLQGHIIRGKNVYPFSATLVAAWDTLAMSLNVARKQLSVEFHDVHLISQPVLHDQRDLRLSVALHRGTGRFEILDDNRKVATGFIVNVMRDTTRKFMLPFESNEKMELNSEDVYQLLYDKDYLYQGEFKTIHKANPSLTEAQIIWNDNWVTFLDGVLQFKALTQSHNNISQPFQIRRLCIDIKKHYTLLTEQVDGKTILTANILEMGVFTRCGGVLIEDMNFKYLPTMPEVVALKVLNIPRSPINITGVIRDEQLRSETVHPDKDEADNYRVTLRSTRIGDLESLQWVQAPEPIAPGVTVNVHYAAINDIDVKRATGQITFNYENECEKSYGMDFSGTTDSGQRVMGMVLGGAVSGRVKTLPDLLWPVPEYWSLEEAATVPSAYVFAFYCLAIKIEFSSGLRVLVHGGAGALGQAAISIALAHGCEVFATVSDVRKKRFLLRLFPDLKEDHVGNSRDHTFGDMVRIMTKRKGVDVVISCVKGELKNVTFECCAVSSKMLDVAQIPNKEEFNFGLFHLSREKNYVRIDLNSIYANQNIDELKRLQLLISEGIKRGYVRPLSHMTYPAHAAPRAFRLLAASQHRGRVLLRLRGSPLTSALPAQPSLSCSADRCHLLLCSGDSFGIQLAERLVNRGVRKLHIYSENIPPYLRLKIQTLQNMGANVKVSSIDLTSEGIVSLLAESNRLGPVEGIYVVASGVTENTKEKVNTMVTILEAWTRKLCSSVRYFAVLNIGVTIGQKTCLNRIRDGLPVTILHLPVLRKFGEDPSPTNGKDTLSYRAALEATEQALCSSHPALLAYSHKVLQPTLLQQIARLAEINIAEDIDATATLLDLGITPAIVPAVGSFLCDVYNVALPDDVVLNLSIQEIKDIEDTVTGPNFKQVKGLGTFFSYIDSDELLATTEMVLMSTLTSSTLMRDDEFDVSKTHLCIVPGLEGHHGRFRVMCERLKLPALVLQPGLDYLHETVRERAERFAKYLLKKMELKDNFYLLGYETGVLVALEVVDILEQNGLTGTLFCVGGTPEDIQAMLESQLREYDSNEALQDAVARHMFSLMVGNTEGVDKALEKASSWQEKVEACVRTLLGKVAHSAQYARALIEAAYTSIQLTRVYKSAVKALRSRLVVLRAADVYAHLDSAHRYSQQPTVLHALHAPLAHAAQDLRCSAIINSHLDADMLHAFEQRNLCETYLLNGDLLIDIADNERDID